MPKQDYSLKASIESSERIQKTKLVFDEEKTKQVMKEVVADLDAKKESLEFRLRKRAEIRRQIPTRKSVQNNEPDRLADLLEEAANELNKKDKKIIQLLFALQSAWPYVHARCTINSVLKEIKTALFPKEENEVS